MPCFCRRHFPALPSFLDPVSCCPASRAERLTSLWLLLDFPSSLCGLLQLPTQWSGPFGAGSFPRLRSLPACVTTYRAQCGRWVSLTTEFNCPVMGQLMWPSHWTTASGDFLCQFPAGVGRYKPSCHNSEPAQNDTGGQWAVLPQSPVLGSLLAPGSRWICASSQSPCSPTMVAPCKAGSP